MILLDATIPVALIGDDEPLKEMACRLLEREITAHSRLVTDALVLDQILERCWALESPEAIERAMEALLGVADEVIPVDEVDVVRAKEMLHGPERLSPRCCLHLAVMERHGVKSIMSFDAEFDRYPAVTRLTSR